MSSMVSTAIDTLTTEQKPAAHKRNLILFVYHQNESELWKVLCYHLDMMVWRYRGIAWKVVKVRDDQDAQFYQELLAQIDQALLFVPLTSAALLDVLWSRYQNDPRMAVVMRARAVAPILGRVAPVNVKGLNRKPLARQTDHDLDQACAAVARALAKHLKRYGLHVHRTTAPMVAATVQMHGPENPATTATPGQPHSPAFS